MVVIILVDHALGLVIEAGYRGVAPPLVHVPVLVILSSFMHTQAHTPTNALTQIVPSLNIMLYLKFEYLTIAVKAMGKLMSNNDPNGSIT